jgi:AAA+ ATPase superfamily predicted ATPase
MDGGIIFINRFEEKKLFNEIFNSHKKEVFILYGRRRTGKSALLKEVSKNRRNLFYTARKISKTEQLNIFSIAGSDVFIRILYHTPFSMSYVKKHPQWWTYPRK